MCIICLDARNKSIYQLSCKHSFCYVCISKNYNIYGVRNCPLCNTKCEINDIYLFQNKKKWNKWKKMSKKISKSEFINKEILKHFYCNEWLS
jgi:hypothetical protein